MKLLLQQPNPFFHRDFRRLRSGRSFLEQECPFGGSRLCCDLLIVLSPERGFGFRSWLRFRLRPWFRPWLRESRLHRQADSFQCRINTYHLDLYHIADGHGLSGIANVAVREFRYMDQSVLMDAEVHKDPKIRHVRDIPLDFHALLKVRNIPYVVPELRCLEGLARIPCRLQHFVPDIGQCVFADLLFEITEIDGVHSTRILDNFRNGHLE